MHDKLKEIFTVKLKEIESISFDKERIFPIVRFSDAIKDKKTVALIAEIKKASPSKGVIRENFNIDEIVSAYKNFPAQAISVLTDNIFFSGDNEYLKQVKQKVSIPVLRKDFIIDEKQIIESFQLGADIILLIVAMLDDKKLKEYIKRTDQLGIEALVEVHDETELNRALSCGAKILGINNRDLNTFKVDLNNCLRLVDKIPHNVIKVAESGVNNSKDLKKIEQAGFDAVLIGEAFMGRDNLQEAYNELFVK